MSVLGPAVQPAPRSKTKPTPVAYTGSGHPDEDEETAVHEVYERIAPHFSQTRHKPWPLIISFLHSLPPGSLGLDSGAGNGKYLPTAREAGVEMVAIDRSMGLLGIARTQGDFGSMDGDRRRQHGEEARHENARLVKRPAQESGVGECVRGDLCGYGWRQGVFDFAISIAAVHHLSTPERRQRSIQALIHPLVLRSEPPYSRFLVYVWAYEQGSGSKRKMGVAVSSPAEATRRRLDEEVGSMSDVVPPEDGRVAAGSVQPRAHAAVDRLADRIQDVLVPWVLQKPGESSRVATPGGSKPRTRSPATRSTKGKQPALPSEEVSEPSNDDMPKRVQVADERPEQEQSEPQVFHRYYHLFVEGELRELVEAAARASGFILTGDPPQGRAKGGGGEGKWLRVKGVGWEADNWWLEGEVGLDGP